MGTVARLELAAPALDERHLMRLTNRELDDVFRASPPGPLPAGVHRGTALVFNGTLACRIIALLAYLFAWQGKRVDPDGRELVNRITPFRLPLIRATGLAGRELGRPAAVHPHRLLGHLAGREDGARRDAPGRTRAAARRRVAVAPPRRLVHAARAAGLTPMPHQVAADGARAGRRRPRGRRPGAACSSRSAPRALPSNSCCRSPTWPASTSPGCSSSRPAPTWTAPSCPPACSTWPTSTPRWTGTCATSPPRAARASTPCSVTATATRQTPSPGTRLAWLLHRTVAPAADYVHRIGRTVEQVRDEHRLRDAVETYPRPARRSVPDRLTAVEAHGRIRSFALRRDDLAWARRGPRRLGLGYRVRDAVHLVAAPARRPRAAARCCCPPSWCCCC